MRNDDTTPTSAVSWCEFAGRAPDLSALGRAKLHRGIAYLATIRRDGSPRLHPVTPFIGEGMLVMATEPTSPKIRDLKHDGRYTLHCSVSRDGPLVEFGLSGRAVLLRDPERRACAVAATESEVPEDYALFEFLVVGAFAIRYDGDGRRIVQRWHAPRAVRRASPCRMAFTPVCGGQI